VKTAVFLLLLALALIVLFVAFRTMQLVALLFLAAILLSWVYSRLLARYVVVRRVSLLARAHRFEPLEIALVLENRSFLPAHYLTVLDPPNHFFVSAPGRFLVSLRAGERKSLRYTLESQTRGEYILGPAVLSGSDPLGLFPFSLKQAETQEVVIYPEVLPLGFGPDSGLPAGSIRSDSHIYEDVTRYRSLREYLPGDELKRLNWKASARSGRLLVTDYLPTLYAPTLILLDLNRESYPMRYRYHRLERAVVLAASLTMRLVNLGQEVGLVAAGGLPDGALAAVPPRSGAGQAMILLQMLARLQPLPEGRDVTRLPAEAGIELPGRSRLEVIAPVLDAQQWGSLRRLRERGCEVDVFWVGAQQTPDPEAELRSREFRFYRVADFGDALIDH
jgi:uncharacterized protein (DUF58 family)